MDLHSRPIDERIDWLLQHARQHADRFSSPEATLARLRYRAEHPSAIAALKCMDGRLNLSVATRMPLGIIQPFRNLGGMFDLGWPHLGEVLTGYVLAQIAEGRRVLILCTYHYSKGDPKRGCAGFHYDTAAALAYTRRIRQQIETVFGTGHDTVYPIVCGFETDDDALIFHGHDDEQLDLSTLAAHETADLSARLQRLYPDMPGQLRHDLEPLLHGNLAHVAATRRTARALDIDHREWMICIGRGFDFLHTPNLALIIGPYSPDLGEPIRRAAGIIENNMQSSRIPSDGMLLLASVPYTDIGVDRARAELKARFLSDFAADMIRGHHPSLADTLRVLTAVLDWRSRRLELLGDGNGARRSSGG
jgi:hypothetical protein